MARVVDLDAARIARAEVEREAVTLRFNGKDWQLPSELPWAFVEASSGNTQDVMRALATLLGEQWEEFVRSGPSISDVTTLVEAIPALYGLDNLGNS